MKRNECDFPGCKLEVVGIDYVRCLLHLNVMVSSSYMNDAEVADE